jgi:hypothetical protein
MNMEKYNKPMAAVFGMSKTDFHIIKLQSTILMQRIYQPSTGQN